MKQESAHHGKIWQWFHRRDEPQPTPWQQFQEKQQTDAMRLVAFLRAPASEICARLGRPVPRQTGPMRPVPTRGDVQLTMLARPVVTVQPVPPPAPKPEPRHYSHEELVEMIRTQPRSTSDLPAHLLEEVHRQVAALHEGEDLMPQWRGNDAAWLNSEPRQQATGYMDELATLRHNSDTLEVPAYVRQKHTKESE